MTIGTSGILDEENGVKGKKMSSMSSKGRWTKGKDAILITIASLLYIICFPLNPLVLTGILEVQSYTVLNILGFIVWAFGMVLVMAPIVMFPKRGGVPKGKSFVHTTKLVDTGVYSIVRHPQYTGGIYAIFVTTFLIYPHWLFALLGIIGSWLTYLSTLEEDRRLIEKFGEEYQVYIDRVPRMNVLLGIVNLLKERL